MARNVISDTRFRGASASQHGLVSHNLPVDTSSTDALKQGILPLPLSISDSGTEAVIEMTTPVHEPEVTKKKRAGNKAKAKAKSTKAKSKKLLPKPARVAKKAAQKSPVKRAPSHKLTSSAEARIDVPSILVPPIPLIKQFEVTEIENTQCSCPMEIERLGAPNELGISAIASAAQDATPPWKVEPAAQTEQDLTPLPRSASLQLYYKSSWLDSASHWIRSNVLTLFVQRQKAVAVTKPAPKKLHPREMALELNRLAEENRALRRKLAQYQKAE